MYLVMEYCSGGDLAKYIRRHRRIPEVAARALLRQLSAGLRELWSRNLVHVRRAPGPLSLIMVPELQPRLSHGSHAGSMAVAHAG